MGNETQKVNATRFCQNLAPQHKKRRIIVAVFISLPSSSIPSIIEQTSTYILYRHDMIVMGLHKQRLMVSPWLFWVCSLLQL